MSCKSNISVANTASTSVLANSIIPLGTIVRRYGNALNQSGSAITINECGYYLVTVNATFTAPAAGVVTLTLLNNGNAVPGATSSASITTATTQVESVSFTTIVRVFNNCNPVSLTVNNAGVAATMTNVSVSVVKV